MGSLKTIALAGAFTVAASASALAADLFAPAPPQYQHQEIGGGWYLRGDVGVGALSLGGFEGVDTAPGFVGPPGGYRLEHKSIGDQAFAGAGIGYQFGGWLRFDVTGEYRTGASVKTVESYAYPGVSEGLNFVDGRLSSLVGLANLYLDLGTWHGFTPFVGAGVGVAHHYLSGVKDFGPSFDFASGTGGFGAGYVAEDKSTTGLAWAVHAGLGYAVNPNLKLELAYRYLNMGKANSGMVSCFQSGCPGTVYSYKEIDSHDVKIGMRWMLGGPVATAVPMEEPLIRKY